MVPDEKALARMRMMGERYGKTLQTRNDRLVRSGAVHLTVTRRFMRKIARAGGTATNARRTPTERSKAARRAAMARWHGIGRKRRKIVRI
jgi:hypothetical protein